MRITRLDGQLLHVPLSRPRAARAGAGEDGPGHVAVLLVHLDTDSGLRGLGMAYTLQGTGRALHALAVDDLAPLVRGEDPLDHERLGAKVYWRLQGIGRRGLVAQAYSALDLALWDLKGKAAGLPLFKLLGGARESAPAYVSDTGRMGLSPEEILDASRPYLDQGLMGIKVQVGGDPEHDADRVTRVREALGEEVWLGINAGQRYDYGTALAMGHFFEEEIGADWFEDPVLCEDMEGHARLASKLEIPLAGGGMLQGRDEFQAYLTKNALGVLLPDVTRLGGLTNWLKVAALAEAAHRPVSPHSLPEVGVHLVCGLPGVVSVEYAPWLFSLYQTPPRLEQGRLVPPPLPGLGLEVNPEEVARHLRWQS